MARTENDLKCCMITQDLDPQHWDWKNDELQILQFGNITDIAQVIKKRLDNAGFTVAESYAIGHDKDVHEIWDEIAMQKTVEYKTNHIHDVIRFEDGKGATLSQIALAVGLAPQFVEKAGKGKYGYDNMLAYLIHIKYKDKYQYSPDEVVTLCGTSYKKIYNENKERWLKGRAKVQSAKAKEDIDWLESQILTGQMTKNQIMLTDEYYDIYARYKRRCDDAFDTYGERKIYRTLQAMENGEFKVSVFYITGKSGSGKSMFTDSFVTDLQKRALQEFGETWTRCDVASSNPFDDYRGEEIMVMDDLRGMALTASDWLKLLDPDRANMGSARYRNRQIACRAIIINSERDVLDFFYFLKNSGGGDRSEAMDQFFRRILARVEVVRYDDTDERALNIGMSQRTDAYTLDSPNMNEPALNLNYDFDADMLNDMSYEDAKKVLTDIVIARNSLKDGQDYNAKVEAILHEYEEHRLHMGKALIADIQETIRQEEEQEAELKRIAEQEAHDAVIEQLKAEEKVDENGLYNAWDRQYHEMREVKQK